MLPDELSLLFYLCDALKSAPHKYKEFRKICVQRKKSEKFMSFIKRFDEAEDVSKERLLVLKDIT